MTSIQIAFPRALWKRAHDHLFRDGEENFCFFLAGVGRTSNGWRLAARDAIPIETRDLEDDPSSPRLVKLDVLLDVFNRAHRGRAAVLEAHTHPMSGERVWFSRFDDREMPQFAKYALERLPMRPYVATVWGESSIAARAFLPDGQVIDPPDVSVVGDVLARARPKPARAVGDERFARQTLAFGEAGQARIRETRVAIAGLGGLGAHVAQQLAYLGVRDLVLIDPDIVESTNLNRLIGATPKDVGSPKVDVAARLIEAVAGHGQARVETRHEDIREESALRAVLSADVVVGCFDNDGPRLILNELARAFTLPYIDLATGIDANNGKVTQAGGRIVVVHADGPCLSCLRELDSAESRDFLASSLEREQSRRLGYVKDEPNPSVVTLNGVVASLGATEFMALVTAFRASRAYTTYYALEPHGSTNVSRRQVARDPDCYTCSLAGIGDELDLTRYEPRTTPSE